MKAGISPSRFLVAAGAIPWLLHPQTPAPTFQSKVNLVPVPVVVRDKHSQTVGNLTQGNFQVFDNGKLQSISRFTVEKSGIAVQQKSATTEPQPVAAPSAAAITVPALPDRFVGYVFDDLHFKTSDLMQAKIAALKHFESATEAGDSENTRAAVFTTSGVDNEDFTSDRSKLKAALNRLMTRSGAPTPQSNCPYLTYYAADLILNRNDSQALQAAIDAAMHCPVPPPSKQAALSIVRAAAFQAASLGETDTRITISVLRNMIRRIAALPGQRTLVLVSPGFIFPQQQQDISGLIDLAVRMNVVINSIDARGLYVDARYDVSRSSVNDALAAYERDEATGDGQTLGLLADGTGGASFANSHDLLAGFRRAGSQPEFTYVLGFSPRDLKIDGKFHSIKVKLKDSPGMSVQARRGYYAPKHAVDPADQIKQDIDDALFSRQEFKAFPLGLNTQIAKGNGSSLPRLTVIMQVGLKELHFNKVDGLNVNQVTLVAGLFDKNGNYLSGTESKVDLHYKDETLQARVNAGLAVKTNFDNVKPGSYVVRLVARDSEGQMIATANGAVEVP